MSFLVVVGYLLAVLIGVSLGILGSGGSILAVPIMVYVLGIKPVSATAYSLFVVGGTAGVGALRRIPHDQVRFGSGLTFAFPSIVSVFVTRRYVITAIPPVLLDTGGLRLTRDSFIMLLFALFMAVVAVSLLRSTSAGEPGGSALLTHWPLPPPLLLGGTGAVVGVLAGLVGAGGGFLIVPAMLFVGGLGMQEAVGTSLFVIALQSLLGGLGEVGARAIDVPFVVGFSLFTIVGVLVGDRIGKSLSTRELRRGFGVFVILMSAFVFVRELL